MDRKINKKRRRSKMATQLQATPTLYGKDAKEIFNEINRVPSKEQRIKIREHYRKMFEGVKTKGPK
ncbi:hypothetical protein [Phosphitispora fastidiosa]|uniref:hypothetical protein n=1 Tax=Phosphitispora fastidiosa TaxID=2837202 RepID=UPI001E43E330|nr:hypothetical protein [Phosphitispora fastidiosa]MBU7005260.1 hypothetical protein [Phosphitispora fastidiosa]